MSDTIPVVTITRETLESVRDLRVIHNLDAERCLAEMISLQLQQELDEQIISDINTILDSEPTEDITMVGGGRNLWLSEEAMADIRAWGGIDGDVVLRQEAYARSWDREMPREKVNWRKEGF